MYLSVSAKQNNNRQISPKRFQWKDINERVGLAGEPGLETHSETRESRNHYHPRIEGRRANSVTGPQPELGGRRVHCRRGAALRDGGDPSQKEALERERSGNSSLLKPSSLLLVYPRPWPDQAQPGKGTSVKLSSGLSLPGQDPQPCENYTEMLPFTKTNGKRTRCLRAPCVSEDPGKQAVCVRMRMNECLWMNAVSLKIINVRTLCLSRYTSRNLSYRYFSKYMKWHMSKAIHGTLVYNLKRIEIASMSTSRGLVM